MNGRREQSPNGWTLPRLGCALFACLLIGPRLPAQTRSQNGVKAAYLYNFRKFVSWPADAENSSSTFDICILGQDPFDGALDKLIDGGQVDGKPVRKRTIANPAEAAGCAIVYIADQEAADLPSILHGFSNQEALLVSALPHFTEDGGMIQFVLDGDQVRFKVNLDAAAKSHLTLSSELLKVAVSVTGSQRSGVAR